MAESETNPGLVSANRDQNTLANPMFTQLSTGSAAIGVTGTSLDVNVTNASLTVTATDLDIRNLSETQDHVLIFANTAKDGTGTDYVPLVDADGHLQVDILSGAGGVEYTVDDVAPATPIGGAIVMERDDALGGVTPVEGDWVQMFCNANGALWVTVDGSVTVTATDLDIRDLNFATDSVEVRQATHDNLNGNANIQVGDVDVSASNPVPVSKDGNANSETNPIYVQEVKQAASGNEVHDYNEATSLAADTTANHDYTAVGTFFLKKVTVAATGAFRAEVIVDPAGTATTVRVAHSTGRQGDYKELNFDPPVEVATTDVLRVAVKNRQGSANDIHSSIDGYDV